METRYIMPCMKTTWQIGDEFYGIKILGIFHERYVTRHDRIGNRPAKYYGTEYYVKFHNKLYFLEEYQISTLIWKQKQMYKRIKELVRQLILMLEK